jgi:DNA-binding response OmpR family regulator
MVHAPRVLLIGATRHEGFIASAAAAAKYEYFHRRSAEGALAYLRTNRPDLVIISENLDPLLRTLIAISARRRYPGTEIIGLTARSEFYSRTSKLDAVLDITGSSPNFSDGLDRLLRRSRSAVNAQ